MEKAQHRLDFFDSLSSPAYAGDAACQKSACHSEGAKRPWESIISSPKKRMAKPVCAQTPP